MERNDIPEQLLRWKVKLRQLIKDLGLTQEGFANQIGVKRRAVCRWVSDQDGSIPHKTHLRAIRTLMEANDKPKLHATDILRNVVRLGGEEGYQ